MGNDQLASEKMKWKRNFVSKKSKVYFGKKHIQDREYRATVFKKNLKTEAQLLLTGHSSTEVALHTTFDTIHYFS